MNEHGIKETKEVLIAVNELALIIIKHVKDGVQVSDIPAIAVEMFRNEAFKDAIANAVKDIAMVPAEVKDINVEEGLELAKEQISYLPRLLEALKK